MVAFVSFGAGVGVWMVENIFWLILLRLMLRKNGASRTFYSTKVVLYVLPSTARFLFELCLICTTLNYSSRVVRAVLIEPVLLVMRFCGWNEKDRKLYRKLYVI